MFCASSVLLNLTVIKYRLGLIKWLLWPSFAQPVLFVSSFVDWNVSYCCVLTAQTWLDLIAYSRSIFKREVKRNSPLWYCGVKSFVVSLCFNAMYQFPGHVAKKPYNPIVGEVFQCSYYTSRTSAAEPSANSNTSSSARVRTQFIAEQVKQMRHIRNWSRK